MKILKKIDDWFERIFMGISTLMLICLVLIVFISVLTRFVFKFSTGNLADTPPYFMIWLVFIGAVFATKHSNHIRIDVVNLVIKNEAVLEFLNAILYLIGAVCFVLVAKDSFSYMALTKSYGNAEPSLHIPYWILYSVITFNFCFTALYYFVNCIKGVMKGVKLCRHC